MTQFPGGRSHEEMIRMVSALVRESPNEVRPQVMLAQIYALGKQWTEAAEASRTALRLDAENADAFEVLGLALKNLGKKDEALEACFGAIVHGGPTAERMANMAGACLEFKDFQWAVYWFDQALAVNPADSHLRQGRVLAMAGLRGQAQ